MTPWVIAVLVLLTIVGFDWAVAHLASKPKHKSKHPLAVKLRKLNPDDAVRHWKRLDALGAFK